MRKKLSVRDSVWKSGLQVAHAEPLTTRHSSNYYQSIRNLQPLADNQLIPK